MKMPLPMFDQLRAAVAPHMQKAPGDNLIRHRWDAFWRAVDLGGFSAREAYDADLNDKHIDTALRRIQRSIHG